MRVIKSDNAERCTCENCNSILEFDNADKYIGICGLQYVKCPVCGSEIEVSENRIVPPTCNKTFMHTTKETAKETKDADIQEMIDQCLEDLANLNVDSCFVNFGDTLVCARYDEDDMIEVYVTKDFWTDFTDVKESF